MNDLFLLCGVMLLFKLFCLMNRGRTKGENWSAANKLKPPSNFIAGRPKPALLFWLFSDFRCGVPLFIVFLVIYKYKIGEKRC